MSAPIKICTRRSFRNRRAPAQKSKRRLLSQKLGGSETTRVDLRNRRGVCFLKSWAAQRPRRPISDIEEVCFLKSWAAQRPRGPISEIEEVCFLKSWAAQRPRGPISEIEEAPTFPALSAPVTRTQLCGNYGHSVEDFWRSRKHMNRTVQSPTSHTQQ
ncbi:hypothetical protein ACFX19_004387 [Malus domestica]